MTSRRLFAPLFTGTPAQKLRARLILFWLVFLLGILPLAIIPVVALLKGRPDAFPHQHLRQALVGVGLVLICITGIALQARRRWLVWITVAGAVVAAGWSFALR